jgi:hypothetical protein
VIPIDCVLGAAYAGDKSYYEYIHGLNGLVGYGVDEEFLSLKYWLTGSSCILVKDFEVGHIYREKNTPGPFVRSRIDACYNRLYLLETLFPPGLLKDTIDERIKATYSAAYMDAKKLIGDKKEYIEKERSYLKSIFASDYIEILSRLVKI